MRIYTIEVCIDYGESKILSVSENLNEVLSIAKTLFDDDCTPYFYDSIKISTWENGSKILGCTLIKQRGVGYLFDDFTPFDESLVMEKMK